MYVQYVALYYMFGSVFIDHFMYVYLLSSLFLLSFVPLSFPRTIIVSQSHRSNSSSLHLFIFPLSQLRYQVILTFFFFSFFRFLFHSLHDIELLHNLIAFSLHISFYFIFSFLISPLPLCVNLICLQTYFCFSTFSIFQYFNFINVSIRNLDHSLSSSSFPFDIQISFSSLFLFSLSLFISFFATSSFIFSSSLFSSRISYGFIHSFLSLFFEDENMVLSKNHLRRGMSSHT